MSGQLVFLTGSTGFIGFAVLTQALNAGYHVRVSVRKENQIKTIKQHKLIASFDAKNLLEFVVIPDITADGAFDNVLKDVVFIEHIASPLPNPTSGDQENDTIIPAIKGTTSILNSALKTGTIRKVVITSSVVGVVPEIAILQGDEETVYTADSRVVPRPAAPWGDAASAYRSSKALALHAIDDFIREKKPQFSIVNIMPGYVIGCNELATKAEDLAEGSNLLALSIVLGMHIAPAGKPVVITDLRDAARIHVEALDEKVRGNSSFLLAGELREFDDANDFVRKHFPTAVEKGLVPLGGSMPSLPLKLATKKTHEVFGSLKSYEDAVKSVIAQYIELKEKNS